jgi:hypothetical protein
MAAVLYPLTVALIPISSCKYVSLSTMSFVSCAWAQSAVPDQPITPPAPQEGQSAPQQPQEGQSVPQQPQEQAGPKPPEAPPVEQPQPLPGQPPSEQKQPEPEAQKKPAKGPIGTTFVDLLHDEISKRILTTATYFDSFFGNQRYLAELNQSYVRFRYNVFLEHESPMLLRPEVQVRIVLPQLREKTHLEISGTPKETDYLSATQAPATTEQFENPDKNVTAGVTQIVQKTDRVNFIVRAGLQWHKGRPVLILGPRFRMLFPLDHWNLRFIQEVILRNDTGYQLKTTFDLERPLPHGLFFRATNDWIRTDHVDGYIYTIIFNVDQPLSPQRVLGYEWVNIFQTQPVNELTEVDLRVRYRQRIWRDWLFFEVAPQYRFPRDRGFEATPGILFRLEAMFGHY